MRTRALGLFFDDLAPMVSVVIFPQSIEKIFKVVGNWLNSTTKLRIQMNDRESLRVRRHGDTCRVVGTGRTRGGVASSLVHFCCYFSLPRDENSTKTQSSKCMIEMRRFSLGVSIDSTSRCRPGLSRARAIKFSSRHVPRSVRPIRLSKHQK